MTLEEMEKIAATFAQTVDYLVAQIPDKSMIERSLQMANAGVRPIDAISARQWWIKYLELRERCHD
jgi:hypothetical protein